MEGGRREERSIGLFPHFGRREGGRPPPRSVASEKGLQGLNQATDEEEGGRPRLEGKRKGEPGGILYFSPFLPPSGASFFRRCLLLLLLLRLDPHSSPERRSNEGKEKENRTGDLWLRRRRRRKGTLKRSSLSLPSARPKCPLFFSKPLGR